MTGDKALMPSVKRSEGIFYAKKGVFSGKFCSYGTGKCKERSVTCRMKCL